MIISITPVVLVLLVVGVHYEVLNLTSSALHRSRMPHRFRVAAAVLIALGAHFCEVIIFAVGWLLTIRWGVATISISEPSFSDLVYYSLATYTSLGYGDIVPMGSARILAGIEALTGLVLIAWTASFTYLEMREFWSSKT